MAGQLTLSTISDGTNSTSATNLVKAPCVAWINFGYVSSVMTTRASYNISSVTRNGSGNYTVNFTNAISDANYAVVASSARNYVSSANMSITSLNSGNNAQTQTTSAFTIITQDQAANLNDVITANCAVFR